MFDQLGILPLNLLWQCLSFVLLIYLLYRFAYAPILRMLDERANRISESMDQAEAIASARELRRSNPTAVYEIRPIRFYTPGVPFPVTDADAT